MAGRSVCDRPKMVWECGDLFSLGWVEPKRAKEVRRRDLPGLKDDAV